MTINKEKNLEQLQEITNNVQTPKCPSFFNDDRLEVGEMLKKDDKLGE